jgi:hypothetical protein
VSNYDFGDPLPPLERLAFAIAFVGLVTSSIVVTDSLTLIETCKLIGVEPHNYLADIITRIVNGHPQSKLDELLPWANPAEPKLQAVA